MDPKALFAPLGPTYERCGAILSLGQDPRWRRFLVSQTEAGPEDRVLDVATGTGLVARELVARRGCRVVGVDQSAGMLAEARRRANGRIELVKASAERLPRTVRTGGTIAGLEFGVPRGPARPLWELYVRAGLPAAGAVIGKGWREAGSFLGGSIRAFNERWPEERLHEAWRAAGIDDVHSRRLSLGGGVVTWGRKN